MDDKNNGPNHNGTIVPAEGPWAALAERYDNSPAIRAFIVGLGNLLGPFGAPLAAFDAFASARSQIVFQERVTKLIEAVAGDLKSQPDATIPPDFFDTEGGVDLTRRAVEATARIRDEQRREAVGRVFVAAATGSIPPSLEPESMIAVIGEMSEGEATLLGAIWRRFGVDDVAMSVGYEWDKELLPDGMDSEFLLKRLIGRGLLAERLRAPGGGGYDAGDRELFVWSEVEFTDTGFAIANHLLSRPPAQVVVTPLDPPQ